MKTITSLARKKNVDAAGYLAFAGLVLMVENAAKTHVLMKNFLSVFKKQKTEVLERAIAVDRSLSVKLNNMLLDSILSYRKC